MPPHETAIASSRPFLTLRDPNAEVRGSRDPLGTQALWSRLGREVVRNLTTVTTSLRGFTTLLLGLYFVGRLVDDGEAEVDDLAPLFLKFEQLAAYSRIAASLGGSTAVDTEVLGILRTRANLQSGSKRVTISAEQKHQIMSDQRSYGLWGLYSAAARASGLVEASGSRLTPAARAFVESEYLGRLPQAGRAVYRFLQRDRVFDPAGRDAELARALASGMGRRVRAAERAVYHEHLVTAAGDARQTRLWEALYAHKMSRHGDPSQAFGRTDLREVLKRLGAGNHVGLVEALERIAVTEPVIAPLGRFFGLVLQRDGATVASVHEEARGQWGKGAPHVDPRAFDAALQWYATGGSELPGHASLSEAARCLASGRYKELIRCLVDLNSAVMAVRGGAPWLAIKDGLLDVAYHEEETTLPTAEELPELWVSTYFINALQSVGMQVHGGS